ncbi:ISL3 family transposase [[Mycobacterium] burgundiense]|uniref:ISL3 family transposase n=1 Tax=[Mycobacterium] burgundiense TaxID=3064286 RepID=A0ABM9LQ19_9MYCO|nr:ISL3 family transposase [Mycolicibacterium sp. MU0053]CAJ1496842.1 ISL3 family transposase [Mycolicibacterium sp. MU0053]CAJ1502794.1 ISL3 family transposase [Mycolicibacterium sp. MU0053]
MRVNTAFNRLLQIPGATVTDVVIGDGQIDVHLRPKARLLRCPCGKRLRAVYDRRRRRWRHLDLARAQLWLVYEIRRLDCPDCGVITEELPWARPGARHTRDFEDMVLWLAQRTDRTSVAALMRCAWETVTAIIGRGVAELLDQRRLQTLYRIGVDEICYRHPHRYLTIIGNHDTGTVVDVQPGRSEQSLANFYAAQTDSALAHIDAVSMDVSRAYTAATTAAVPNAVICYDGFHVMQWVQRALDRVFAESIRLPGHATADWKAARWALRTGENKLTDDKRALVNQIARTNRRIGRAWTLKEQARDLYRHHHEPDQARRLLKAWITAAKRSRIPAFVALSKRFEVYFEPILAAIELRISNALIEGINAKIRLINARGYGHHSAQTLTSMIYLCLGGLQVKLPTRT